MAPAPPRLRILSVGGNAVSAFLSWRLQATNACDVTLVWKSGFDTVSQYGISFQSKLFGNERFKPRHGRHTPYNTFGNVQEALLIETIVVRTPEDASGQNSGFDYVLLCVKALPDVYDLAAVIESVVTPQQTCILVNTTHTLGIESHLEQRFPTNVVLSLVSGAEISQLGASEFEHHGSTEIWVGPANKNPTIPASIQSDMAEALAMTLTSGQVDCKVSDNIRQQQYERMLGPIAFHPASVLFETSAHAELLQKVGVRSMVLDIMDELLQLAVAQGCSFPTDFKEKTLESMIQPSETNSIMYQDFIARRPMEVETYLGSPIKLAQEVGLRVPRIETLYALLHNFNTVNQTRSTGPMASSPTVTSGPPPRLSSVPPPRQPMNGNGMRGGRVPSGLGPPPQMRRGPPPTNGYPPRPLNSNGYPPRGPALGHPSRRGSPEGNDLEEFSHLVLYNDDIPEGGVPDSANAGYADRSNGLGPSSNDLALRERELMLRQRELQLREREYNMRRGSRKPTPSHRGGFDDDDDDDDFVDPMAARPVPPMVDPDNFDMMSVTSRRNRKTPSVGQLRKNPEMGSQGRQSHSFAGPRPAANRHRSSARMMQDVSGLHDSLMENPMMAYSSNRYATVDRKTMGDESRANSLTAARLDEFQQGGTNGTPGTHSTPPTARRTSQSPGNPYNTGARAMNRPSPPNGTYMPPNGMQGNGRPSPPGMMRQPVPRYPPGQGNSVATQQVEQHAGVSTLYPPKGAPNVRSLTGSASASAGSGDSGASAHVDSENSAYSSQSSLGPRPPIGVR
ncbi:MAG: hypothetical protein M1812_002472 [Candelaria pacifica]|nr:MAG: hypothetical protein M1812_002472 [Candelaria pacifica]